MVVDTKTIEMTVIYRHPKDYPDHYVVRRWRAYADKPVPAPAELVGVCISLEAARAIASPGRVKIMRSPGDDPVIVETWL